MADVVNLNRFRKRREREAKAEAAAQNRALHGRNATERDASADARRRLETTLDRHRIDPPGGDDVAS
jgi:hypothetical protein